MEELTSGQYVLVTPFGDAPGILLGEDFVISATKPTFTGDTVAAGAEWDLTMTANGVILTDAHGVSAAPMEDDRNGIASGTYEWQVLWDGEYFSFHGYSGSEPVTLVSDTLLEKDFLACRDADIKEAPDSYVSIFTLYRRMEVQDDPEPEEPEARPQNIPLDVVYEDRDVIVVNKPTGMVVHPAPGHPDGTLVNALLYHCGESLSGIGGQKRPGIVHRIDRDTSGLIIAAKNDAAHLALAAQLADHTLARTYECLAVGNFREDSGTVDAPIGRHPVDRKRMAVVRQGGREAVTHWEVIARYPGVTHLRCRLETGRTHQIRVHLAYIGHPILGDTVYGAKKPVAGLTGQCLHAVGLRFIHPRTGEPVELTCPLPEEFVRMLEKLRRNA